MANGIAIAPDEKHFYLNAYLDGSEVRKYHAGGRRPARPWPLAVLPIPRP